ncbi:Uncharacterized protein TCM_029604 [Theobroma cacao]|uniref:Uncharacterized protein n=1 Tax=Theobroma cacao TaxID=3641 RepID=A0A061GE71_THECC|nr:Uncharacterized protein TCM_029604 [Theobroma cacao]
MGGSSHCKMFTESRGNIISSPHGCKVTFPLQRKVTTVIIPKLSCPFHDRIFFFFLLLPLVCYSFFFSLFFLPWLPERTPVAHLHISIKSRDRDPESNLLNAFEGSIYICLGCLDFWSLDFRILGVKRRSLHSSR